MCCSCGTNGFAVLLKGNVLNAVSYAGVDKPGGLCWLQVETDCVDCVMFDGLVVTCEATFVELLVGVTLHCANQSVSVVPAGQYRTGLSAPAGQYLSV